MISVEPRPLTAAVEIDSPPQEVWAVLADVRRTPEWSPECRRVVPLGRLGRGCFLLGLNRRGRVGWATVSRVTVYEPGREIAWTVLTNRSVWSYRIEAADGGTRVQQTRRTPRGEGRFALWFTERFLGGQRDHDDELEAGMRDGLMTIRRSVEAARVA